ncbi:M56 family metallopeptidase [Desulfosporosinus nitroreducens]|uniref:M56 family metallopeptidase n=1 Tax=Desulfosporosinus nitroreducens TaxID=2018668 RepID=A0ABT8QRB8_9FIRM|nr:M56 family metallopeptidase [Desulfosporosinus nitroreducens]MDO0823881.1 M56 family metallopeptidase [Desulfosporosinus nitroreducens]
MSHVFSLVPFFDWIVWTSAKVSVFIIFLLLVKYLFRNKLGATVNYLLWSVVIVGLLLPWTPPSSFSIYNLVGLSTQNSIAGTMSPNLDQNFGQNSTILSKPNATEDNNLDYAFGESEPQNRISLRSIAAAPLTHQCLFLFWIMGIFALIISTIVVNIRFSRSIKGQTINNWYLLAGLEGVKEKLNIKRDIPLTLTQAVRTPSLFGLFKPRLLLPVSLLNHFNSEQLKHVFVHELLHLRHRDIIVNCLVQVLLILHWFNPIIWYAFTKLREDQEIACDAMTVKYFGANSSKDYADTLIKLLESYGGSPRMANLAGLSGSKSLIKRRLINISNLRQSSLTFTVVIVAIVILTGFVTFANAKMLPATENIHLSLPASAKQTAGEQTNLQASNSLPASRQSISINDDSPSGSFWSPNSQNAVSAQVSSWLKTVKPYTTKVPNTDYVDNVVHYNIGPAALHITGSEQFETLIYPAWYVKIDGQEVDDGSITHNINYIQDVVVMIETRTNYVSYLESGPLYNWLKNGEWKTEFSQNSALAPLYQTNKNGQTYGSAFASSIIGNPQPELISAGKDGTSGYVYYEDLMGGPQPKTPEEAIAMQEMGKFEKRAIPLYAADGKTVIGSF